MAKFDTTLLPENEKDRRVVLDLLDKINKVSERVDAIVSSTTSAIVESASNANGSYIRFSDGTLMEWGYVSSYAGLSTGTGGWKLITMPYLAVTRRSVSVNCVQWVGVSVNMSDGESSKQQIQVYNRGAYPGDTAMFWSFQGTWK